MSNPPQKRYRCHVGTMFIRVGMVVTGLAFASCNQVPTVCFGMINGLKVTETAHIPYQVGTHYGFRVDYHDSGRP